MTAPGPARFTLLRRRRPGGLGLDELWILRPPARRSGSARVAEQAGEAAPEPGLIKARAFLLRLLTCVSTLGRIAPPPGCCLRRGEFLQVLPLLGGYQHDRRAAGTADRDRPPASLNFVCGGSQLAGLAAPLVAHPTSMRDSSPRCPGLAGRAVAGARSVPGGLECQCLQLQSDPAGSLPAVLSRGMILMTPDAGRLARLLDTSAGLLVAEAEMAAAGWRFVTVGGLETDSEADLGRYEQVLDAFDAAAGGRHCVLVQHLLPADLRDLRRGRRAADYLAACAAGGAEPGRTVG